MGPLQVCLHNVASAQRPPHTTCLCLGTEEGNVHAQEQGPGYTIHSWESCDVCRLTGHLVVQRASPYPGTKAYPTSRYENIDVHTLQNNNKKAIRSTLCRTYALGCVGMQWSPINLPVATPERKLTLPPLRSYS